jgi:hypothetical protein
VECLVDFGDEECMEADHHRNTVVHTTRVDLSDEDEVLSDGIGTHVNRPHPEHPLTDLKLFMPQLPNGMSQCGCVVRSAWKSDFMHPATSTLLFAYIRPANSLRVRIVKRICSCKHCTSGSPATCA